MNHFIVFSAVVISLQADRPLNWFEIDCPASVANSTCSYTNSYDNDIAVSIFFQTEDASGSSFTCSRSTTKTKTKKHNKKIDKQRLKFATNDFECPKPMIYSYYNTWSYCLLKNLTFPSDLSKVYSYCDYLTADGYEGFYFSSTDFPHYQCPSSMYQSSASDGTVFCLYSLPDTTLNSLPNDTQSYCGNNAFSNNELGFRFNNNGTTTMPPTTPVPTSNDDKNKIVYCSRQWINNGNQMGSAGDCFFILPKNESFICQGNGITNVISTYGVELNDTYFDSSGGSDDKNGIKEINDISKGYINDETTNNNKYGSDVMIYIEMESLSYDIANFNCYYNNDNNDDSQDVSFSLCNFTSEYGASTIYSCNFILLWQASMKCNFNKNNIYVNSAMVRSMANNVKLFDSDISNDILPSNMNICPKESYPNPTYCDCSFTNPYSNNDILIIINALNTDNQFNSFHCFIYGVNVCGWGANNNNNNDMGQCYFILPAQSTYNCTMEWGSTTFLNTTAIKLNTTIFPSVTKYNKNNNNNKKPYFLKKNLSKVQGLHLPISRDLDEMKLLWYKWKVRYNKVYDTLEEDLQRFKNFQYFVSLTDNSAILLSKYEKTMEILNENADLTIKEFESFYKPISLKNNNDNIPSLSDYYDNDQHMYKFSKESMEYNLQTMPSYMNWVDKGAVTPVKNQGQCGSCWSFSTTGVLESHYFIYSNRLQSLSEENLVACDNNDGNDGCNGGWPYLAIKYVSTNGIDTESSYNYTSGDGNVGTCEANNGVKADVSNYVSTYEFIERDEDAMALYIANYGPISITLDAMTQIWWPYTSQSGVMKTCCDKDVDHAVLLVGYNMTSKDVSQHYWIIKNSWGTDWGNNGYIYLQKGSDQCGITYQPVVPVLNQ